MGSGSTEEHSRLVREALLFFGSRGFLIWIQNNGTARAYNNPNRIIKFGLKGLPDLVGVAPNGVSFFCEVKSGEAVLSKEQKLFREQVMVRGAYFLEYRTKDDAMNFLVKFFSEKM